MESGSTPPENKPDDRIPRGAIAVVVVGVIACIAAALLTGGSNSSEAAHLEWTQERAIPDSKPVAVPGDDGAKMQLVKGKIQTTNTNLSGRALFRVLQTVKIDRTGATSKGTLLCTIHATKAGTEIAQSSNGLRMLYPRSSETGIYGQPIEETVLGKFASHGHLFAVLEVAYDMPDRYTSVEGVKLEWPEYEEGTEHLEYTLPEGEPKTPIELTFYTIWKTLKPPAASVACEVMTTAGKATTMTEGSLPRVAPAIDEEAEEIVQEEKEEAGEAAGEGDESREGVE